MKRRNILAAVIVFAMMAAVVMAAIPAPPVNQNLGLPDTKMVNDTVELCKTCHQGPADIHHFMRSGTPISGNKSTTTLGCLDCHPVNGGTLTISRNCHDCHDGTAWAGNPTGIINLTKIRGAPGRPHHNTTKRSASSTFDATYVAADRHCTYCHGDGYLDNYDDGHPVPTYNVSMVTPMASFKVNDSGKLWGGCLACHDDGVEGTTPVYNSDTTHHTVRFWVGYQCNNCHVTSGFRAEPVPDYNPLPNSNVLRIWYNESYPSYTSMFGWDTTSRHLEFRNSTLMNIGDTLNGTGCERCHSVRDLHNIETGAPELGLSEAQVVAAELPGYGHIGNTSDCNGCHQGWSGSTENPFAGPKAMSIDSVSPGVLTSDVATDLTITGSNFVEDPYKTTVLVDNVATTPKSATDKVVVVTATLATGVHSIVVQKDIATTVMTTVTVVKPGTIASAKLTGTALTIDGAGLGAGQTMVVIAKADGTLKASDSITSSTDTQIVAVASLAAVGDTIQVITPTGKATATIVAGTVPPVVDSVTVTAPNGGQSFKRGTTQTITWSTAGASQAANVKIELLKGGTSATVIKSSTPNTGTYSWKIASSQSVANNYKIRITSLAHTLSYTDSSDNLFRITK